MKTLGMRHIALRVKDAQASKKFYMRFFDMQLEWQPDPQNVYLTSNGYDNIALHQESFDHEIKQGLDHLGFIMESIDDVNKVFQMAQNDNITIVKPPKQHRDGAYSFYMEDPDHYVIQIIFHPPIVKKFRATNF